MELRVGVGASCWHSLTFKIFSKGEDAYAICREISAEKQSFHKSGITRFAKVTQTARPPIHSSYLPELRSDRYCTVGRILITTEDDLGPARTKIGKSSVPSHHADGLDATIITIGFTSCHPEDGIGIDYGNKNIKVERLADLRYMTITMDLVSVGTILSGLVDGHRYGPMGTSQIITTRRSHPTDKRFYDILFYYRSELQTYTLWAHCNMQSNRENIYQNAIKQALQESRNTNYLARRIM